MVGRPRRDSSSTSIDGAGPPSAQGQQRLAEALSSRAWARRKVLRDLLAARASQGAIVLDTTDVEKARSFLGRPTPVKQARTPPPTAA